MHHKSLSINIKTLKLCSIIFSKFHSYDCHALIKDVNCISEYLLNLLRHFIVSVSELYWVYYFLYILKPMTCGSTTIQSKIRCLISFNIDENSFNQLHIYQMKMNWMRIRSKIDKVKVISFSDLISTVSAFLTMHH